MRILLLLAAFTWASSANPNFGASWYLNADIRSAPGFRSESFDLGTADTYGSNWFALRIPLANGYAYEQLPGMLTLTLRGNYDSTLIVQSVFPLRRDFEAWHTDPAGLSVFYTPNELDINLPKEGWFRWNNKFGYVQMGRFKPDLGPSPNAVIWGNGAPFQDAILWNLDFGMASFDWMMVSLQPGLTGTPDSVGGDGPGPEIWSKIACRDGSASETWVQSHCSTPNQRNRAYDDPSKTLFLHRIRWDANWGWFALVEQALIGGKDPAPRDFNPYMIWHDNFGDGYTKSSTSAELGITPFRGTKMYWQGDFEDIASPVGETDGETAPTTMGLLAGWRQDWRTDSLWAIWSRIDAVYTDPTFNNHRLPLLKMTARRIYRSNHRTQGEKDSNGNPSFADTYIVDYPLGYKRGADALDLWLNFGVESKVHRAGGELELAWLRQGDKEQWTPWDEAAKMKKNLSGVVEEDKRIWLSGWKAYGRFTVATGMGVRKLRNEDHIRNQDRWDLGWNAGIQARLTGD